MKITLSILMILFLIPILQSQTAEEWIDQAETSEAEAAAAEQAADEAEAQGDERGAANKRLKAQNAWRTAGTARASAAEQLVEKGEYEEAAEQYEQAGDHFEQAGNPGQAAAEREKAASNYKTAADEAETDGDTEIAEALRAKADAVSEEEEENDPKSLTESKAAPERAFDAVVNARGTGRTTGHIATISVKNNLDVPIRIRPDIFYIPSDGRFQSYVGRIPEGVSIPPGGEIELPVEGYCTDVSKPPVQLGETMPSMADWIPVQVPDSDGHLPTVESSSFSVFKQDPVPPFNQEQIPDLINTEGFQQGEGTDGTFVLTWPGTDRPLEGIIRVDKNPRAFGPLIVDLVEQIEEAALTVVESGEFNTPISGDPARALEAVIQQTIWYAVGLLTGTVYNKDDFTSRVHDQIAAGTGTPVDELSSEERDHVATGIDNFWDSFTATGVEAKVLNVHKDHGSEPARVVLVDYEEVKERDDFDVWRRKKYDDYSVERSLNNKTHMEACKKVGVDPDSDLGKAMRRVYEN